MILLLTACVDIAVTTDKVTIDVDGVVVVDDPPPSPPPEVGDSAWWEIDCDPGGFDPDDETEWSAVARPPGGPVPVLAYHLYPDGHWLDADRVEWAGHPIVLAFAIDGTARDCVVYQWIDGSP
jgi:hypothetical protein